MADAVANAVNRRRVRFMAASNLSTIADRNANADRKVLSKDGEARPVRSDPTETFTARGGRQDRPSIRVVHDA
jgi:hypothetical protein